MSAEKLCTKTVACAVWFAALFMTAGASQAADKIKMALLTQPLIWDAGVFAAVDHKFFEAEGIEVEFVSPSTPADGLKLLASGGVQFATAHSTEVITARSKGLPVVSIATNHQYGMAGIMVPATSGVTSLKQLEGKTLGITGIPYNRTMLEYCLTSAGVDLEQSQHRYRRVCSHAVALEQADRRLGRRDHVVGAGDVQHPARQAARRQIDL